MPLMLQIGIQGQVLCNLCERGMGCSILSNEQGRGLELYAPRFESMLRLSDDDSIRQVQAPLMQICFLLPICLEQSLFRVCRCEEQEQQEGRCRLTS